MSGSTVIAAARKIAALRLSNLDMPLGHLERTNPQYLMALDELIGAINSIGSAEICAVSASDLYGDTRESLRVALTRHRIGLVDLDVHDDDPSGSLHEGERFEAALRELAKSVVCMLQLRSRGP